MKITERQLRSTIRKVLQESMGDILTSDELVDFEAWIEDGNAFEKAPDVWVEQTTQYRIEFTLDELKMFFKREYLQ